MQNQSENNKKAWQEPVLVEINLHGGINPSANENTQLDIYDAYTS